MKNNTNNTSLSSRNYYSYMGSSTTPTSSSPLLSSSNINSSNIQTSNILSNTSQTPLPMYDNRSGMIPPLPTELFRIHWSEKEEKEV